AGIWGATVRGGRLAVSGFAISSLPRAGAAVSSTETSKPPRTNLKALRKCKQDDFCKTGITWRALSMRSQKSELMKLRASVWLSDSVCTGGYLEGEMVQRAPWKTRYCRRALIGKYLL